MRECGAMRVGSGTVEVQDVQATVWNALAMARWSLGGAVVAATAWWHTGASVRGGARVHGRQVTAAVRKVCGSGCAGDGATRGGATGGGVTAAGGAARRRRRRREGEGGATVGNRE
jgi:hypothetical protein